MAHLFDVVFDLLYKILDSFVFQSKVAVVLNKVAEMKDSFLRPFTLELLVPLGCFFIIGVWLDR
jgi:hypothetical protein